MYLITQILMKQKVSLAKTIQIYSNFLDKSNFYNVTWSFCCLNNMQFSLLSIRLKISQICVTRCAIWYCLYNLKNVKNTNGWVLRKVTLHGCLSRFLNCTYGTKSHKTYAILPDFEPSPMTWQVSDMTSISMIQYIILSTLLKSVFR